MTDPILRLDPERLGVEPGGQVTLTLTVVNPGTIVDGYVVDVVSTMPLPWVEVTPARLSVYPQQEATAVITFAPPSGPGAPSGTLPFGVRVWSEAPDGGRAVAEGDLDIGSVAGLQAKLTPIASTGRWSGRHTLKVSNWGNAPVRLRVVPEDPAQALGFLASPEVLDIPLGGEATSRLKVRTRHPILRGTSQRLPFQIACEPDVPVGLQGPTPAVPTAGRPVVDGAFNQKPILTRMVVGIAGLALLVGIAGVVWALTRSDDTAAADSGTNPPRPTGFHTVDTVSPDTIRLAWDRMDAVDGFVVVPYDPKTGDASPEIQVGGSRTTSADVDVEPDTKMCFSLVAVRGDLPSKPTIVNDSTCSTSEPATTKEVAPVGGPSPSVTITPDTDTDTDTDGDDGEGEEGSPDGADPDAPPARFISVLDSASADDFGEAFARSVQTSYAEADVPAKVLLTSEFGFAQITDPENPRGSDAPLAPLRFQLWVAYVDGGTPAESYDACAAALAATSSEVQSNQCSTFEVGSLP